MSGRGVVAEASGGNRENDKCSDRRHLEVLHRRNNTVIIFVKSLLAESFGNGTGKAAMEMQMASLRCNFVTAPDACHE